MRVVNKILLIIIMITIALMMKTSCLAYEYIWPIGGENSSETYTEYNYYGSAYSVPYKNGKSGREYIVNNELWPNEEFYYVFCESNYGMDITGIYGHEYSVVSVSNGVVIATSADRVKNPSIDYLDRNRRRSCEGISDACGYGNYVIVEEESTGRCFIYSHLKAGTIQVSKGEKIEEGKILATMGSSGDSGHMNLHFEMRKQKSYTLIEEENENHYLIIANSNTNIDPEGYIGIRMSSKEDIAEGSNENVAEGSNENVAKRSNENVAEGSNEDVAERSSEDVVEESNRDVVEKGKIGVLETEISKIQGVRGILYRAIFKGFCNSFIPTMIKHGIEKSTPC